MIQTARRQDIQGLRALAVVLVVLFHLSASTVPGGYIGVDVFFVISGFLITGHLWREVQKNGRIKLGEFWARRVRRLLPAAFTVLLFSAAIALTLMPETLLRQNLTEIGMAAIYGLNWLLASNSVDYLAADNPASLAQHYWSLSVEEQFYIVWPLLILIGLGTVSSVDERTRRKILLAVLGAIFVLSLVFSIYETGRSQPSAYFITTTRAWEFAAGGLVALMPYAHLRSLTKMTLSWLAIGAIVGSALLMNSESAFPGWIALFPVAGTAVLLWLGDSTQPGSPQRLARYRPIQILGDISYAVYLWHWPLIILTAQLLGRSPGWIWGAFLFATTIILALLTKYFIEDPVRRAPSWLSRQTPTFGLMVVGMLMIGAVAFVPQLVSSASQQKYAAGIDREIANEDGCVGAYAILNDCHDPYAVTETVRPGDIGQLEHWSAFDDEPGCSWDEDVNHSREGTCSLSGGNGATRVMLLGDSHAAQYLSPMLSIARDNDWDFELRSRSVCTGLGVFAPSVDNAEAKGAGCIEWSERIREEIQTGEFDAIIVTNRPRLYEGQEEAGAERVLEFRESGSQVVILGGVPGTGDGADSTGPPGPQCVEESDGLYDPCVWFPEPWEDFLTSVAAQSEAEFIDPREVLCTDDGACHSVIGGLIVYQDNNHLTQAFARTLEPWLENQLADATSSS